MSRTYKPSAKMTSVQTIQPWLKHSHLPIPNTCLGYKEIGCSKLHGTSNFLEDAYHIGPKKPTPFQIGLKKEWAHLSSLELSGCSYRMDISQWQCSSEALNYNSFHLCKHLFKAIPPPPTTFFHQMVHHQTMPLYQHPALHPLPDGGDIGECVRQ